MSVDRQAAIPTARATRIEPLTRLAMGGMAEIWLARELGAAGLERFVVVKRLLPHLSNEPDVVDMFVSEARFIARLVHPNVVQIHELGQDEDGYFLVMEYVKGCTVRELLGAAAAAGMWLPVHVAVSVVEQALRGAHAAHELRDADGRPLGLVHRDLSPHNIMIGPEGDVKLLDFGIAKATEAPDATQAGSLKGKQGYMSPEQCLTTKLDRRTDVFTLGTVCWELMTGKRLFRRETNFLTMKAIEDAEVVAPSEIRTDLPLAFDTVVLKSLARDPEARWRTAEEFRKALIGAARESGVAFSRDHLAEIVDELLADRLAQREQAMRDAASVTAHPDPSELRNLLARSDPSITPPPDWSSRSGVDDVPTVAQPRPSQSGSRPVGPSASTDATGSDDPLELGPADDAATLVEPSRTEGSIPLPLGEPRTASEPSKPGHARWWLLIAALAAASAIVAFLMLRRDETPPALSPSETASSTPSASIPPPSGPALPFVVPPTVKPEVIRRDLAPFVSWLSRAVDRPVELVIADSYDHAAELVSGGRGEMGLFPPLLVVRAMAADPRIRPFAVRLFDGSRGSDGYLLVRDDEAISSAADLKGRTICHVDRTSTSGYLLPRIWMRKAGLDPERDVQVLISGDHQRAMRDLEEGKCDAATVYSGAYLSARQEGIAVGKLRLLAVTGRVPQDALVAGPKVNDDELDRLRQAVLRFSPERDIDAGEVGDVLGISGFGAYKPDEFDTIRAAAEQEGLLPREGARDAGS